MFDVPSGMIKLMLCNYMWVFFCLLLTNEQYIMPVSQVMYVMTV